MSNQKYQQKVENCINELFGLEIPATIQELIDEIEYLKEENENLQNKIDELERQ